MILFVDSFSMADQFHICGMPAALGFVQSLKYTNYSSAGSSQNAIVAADGNAVSLQFNDSGFEQQTITKIFPSAADAWCTGFRYVARGTEIGDTGSVLIRYEAGGTTIVNPGGGGSGHDGGNLTSSLLLIVEDADNTISIYAGTISTYGTTFSPGTLLWNSAGVYVVQFNVPIYIELQVDTSSGSWWLYINDVLIHHQAGQSIMSGIDRISFRSESFETHEIANIYVTSGEQLGPVRVNGFAPNFGSAHQWTPKTPPNLSQVDDFGSSIPTPADDASYVESVTVGNVDTYGFPPQLCYGLILALAINVDCKAVTGSTTIDWMMNQGGLVDLGGSPTLGSNYQIQQLVALLNPNTGTNWTDADLAQALFGFKLSSSGDARVTQFCLEKIVSLRAQPYNCGQGSYSYTS